MRISLKGLNKQVGQFHLLKNIDLDFETEEINVIIGPNGAGKTSLLRIIGLLDKSSSGEVIFDGQSSAGFSARERLTYRQRIGFVFQHPLILAGSVYENIIYGARFRGIKLSEDRIKEAAFKLGLFDKLNQEAKRLSGGEKQRLQLARVLVAELDLYLLDELTSSIDPLSTKRIEDIILELAASKKTVILSTHNLTQAKYLAKRVFFLKAGQLVQEGETKEIFETPLSLDITEFVGG